MKWFVYIYLFDTLFITHIIFVFLSETSTSFFMPVIICYTVELR